jgi:hypothetical protein
MNDFKVYVLAGIGLAMFGAAMALVSPHVSLGNVGVAPNVIQPVDPDTGKPFQTPVTVSMAHGEASGSANFTVPSNRRLVIEQVSVGAATTAGDMQANIQTNLVAGTVSDHLPHRLVLTLQGTFLGRRRFVAHQFTRLYAIPGSRVYALASRNNTLGSATAAFTVSGYLLNP